MRDGYAARELPIRVTKRQRIRTPARTFDTLLVQPDPASLGALFFDHEAGRIRVWLSDNRARIPVRIVSQVRWGRFRADLIGIGDERSK